MGDDNTTEVTRCRPRIPKSDHAYRSVVAEVWGEHSTRGLSLPTATVDYNHFMGDLDSRSMMKSQLRLARTWFPLFFWLFDTTLINGFSIAQQHVRYVVHLAVEVQPHLNPTSYPSDQTRSRNPLELYPMVINPKETTPPPGVPDI